MSDGHTRLARVLGMMGSEHDGEALNAARLAEKIRKEMNKSWQSLITGGGSSSSTDDSLWRGRAFLAEGRASIAERRVRELETSLVLLEAEMTTLRAGRIVGKPEYMTEFGLTDAAERALVKFLHNRMRSADAVHEQTGWPRPMRLTSVLDRLATKHGLKFFSPMRGYYEFNDD